MIMSRVLSLFLRFGEFVCAAVVLGIIAYFIQQHHEFRTGPIGREIYTIVIASLSVLLALVWMIPSTHNILHYPMDFILSLAWFAAFAALVNWIQPIECGGVFSWGNITGNNYCSKWIAAEAFSFIAACFWLASALLGIYIYHKLRKTTTAEASNGGTAATAPRAKRGLFNRRPRADV
ncbi:integral membrane protein [Aulographum hederae CBS 113979]|uniref:Integral membrane protein n=1 Tax=Aulographum hederae CBS 113979 TaxID=1176131 RepID=A0A6G1GNX6_9PEZI|nr:integral membrane protein [Aulographum hederae CBS 113979]